ncbi:EGF domain-containing protein [Myxococcus faecalis]|uniref:EGF domain-containing protein n=1 Tax=Myxococcus faecalis TaxID=3115646 RepID=UPI0024CAAAEE|nr:EGF domain-containing protein [Myxococcus sp. MH1]
MKVNRGVSASRWLSAVFAFVVGGCGVALEEDTFPTEDVVTREQALAPNYANAVVQSGVTLVANPQNAVGAPDGQTANFLSLLGGALTLDMGQGEEGTGPLRIYYRGLSLGVVVQVEFRRADMSVIATGQAQLLDVGVGTHSALVPYLQPAAYRYVTLRGALLSLYQVDAVEATGGATGGMCGDGMVGTGEQCDDGGRVAGDGCGATCQVEPGYTCQGQPSVCHDVNECTNGTAQCSPNAYCTNTPGSYTCTCRPGYTGNGFTCVDIDECALGTDNCGPGEQCVNTPGGFQCNPPSCPSPRVQCGQVCTDLSSDPNNCGCCGNVCGAGKTCSSGVCVGGGGGGEPLRFTATWGRDGDADLVVRTPTGKIVSYGNPGPGPSTDQGRFEGDVASGMGPENVAWYEGTMPPAGTYDVCLKAANFHPAASEATPVHYSVTVKRAGQADQVFTGALKRQDVGDECHPKHHAYVGSIVVAGSH